MFLVLVPEINESINNQFQESTQYCSTRFATRTFLISSREEGRLQLEQVAEKDQENFYLIFFQVKNKYFFTLRQVFSQSLEK